MNGLSWPGSLFNPATDPTPLSGWEILAGPLGLLAFLPLVPLIRIVARRNRRAALIAGGLVWLIATTGPSAGVLLVAVLLASSFVAMLGRLTRSGRIGRRTATAAIWLGLHLMALPLWWFPHALLDYGWQPGRMAPLHAMGLSYFLLRLIAWGVEFARNPAQPLRPLDTVCWLLYPPCMRIGPLLSRERFIERLDDWRPNEKPAWREVGQRLGLALLGLVLLLIVTKNTIMVSPGRPDFFSTPQDYPTRHLLRVFYLIPVQIYLFLWTYNEIAAGLSIWLGIRVDNNFDWLPTATSVRDFWRRWHITVGVWLRKYIYIPLGGNRGFGPLNYLAVFLYCGLWHGAAWSFVAWGASQALALSVQRGWDTFWSRRENSKRPSGPLWTGFCWVSTLHYQLATIVIFADFEHVGSRLLPELARRLFQ